MTTKPLLSPLLSGLVIMLTLANAANAGSLTYYVPILTVSQPGFLPEFNPMLGQLLSVGVVANVSVSEDFNFFPDTVSSVEVSAEVDFFLIPTVGQPNYTGLLPSVYGSATEDFSTPQNGVSAAVDIDYSYFVPAVTLHSFYGTDVWNVQAIPSVYTMPGGPQIDLPLAQGSLTVTYTFSGAGVPEPSSLLLAATGAFILLGYDCRRRFRSAA